MDTYEQVSLTSAGVVDLIAPDVEQLTIVDLHVLRAAEERHSECNSRQESKDIDGLGSRNVDSDDSLKVKIDDRVDSQR
jgi:hypothetical protein